MIKRLLYIILIMCVALPAAANGGAGAKKESDHNFKVAKQLETFSAIYKHLDMMYVDTLDPEVSVDAAIRAMLKSLDPYTEYYRADEVENLRSMLTGKYAGIGAVIKKDLRSGNVVIDKPYEGMPAAKAGLMKGDIILAIDDSSMIGKPVTYVSSRLRGEPGTTFVLKIQRGGDEILLSDAASAKEKGKKKNKTKGEKNGKSGGEVMSKKITRSAIQLPSVPYYGMLTDKTGYILLTQFTDDCARDVRRALVEMRHKGMKSLVFDLRDNGGGSLSEAIEIVNMFVSKGTTLVTTKGKIKRSNNIYRAEQEPLDTTMAIVVLTDGGSASASEITAGSLQDLDRAVVMGTRTFGKGLVQLPVDLPYGGNLKLTTSKYYIPSGRCIQAINYKHTGGGYKEHIPDSLTSEFKTAGGRIVRDGGGIKPDVEVKADSLADIVYYLQTGVTDSTEVMFRYVVDYVRSHESIAPAEEFALSDAEYADFKQRVIESGFKYESVSSKMYDKLVEMAKAEGRYDDAAQEFEALKNKLNRDLAKELDRHSKVIKQLLEYEIIEAYYYQKGVIQKELQNDKLVKEALKLLQDEERYKGILAPAM